MIKKIFNPFVDYVFRSRVDINEQIFFKDQ